MPEKQIVAALDEFEEIPEKKLTKQEFLQAVQKNLEISDFDFDGPATGPGSQMTRRTREIRSSADLNQDGLVILAEPRTAPQPSKYIARMKESTAERKQFQELMQLKFYEKEKDELKKEIGAEPVVFVTPAYKKALGDAKAFAEKLAAEEPTTRNLGNLFRNLLDAGKLSHTNPAAPAPAAPTAPAAPPAPTAPAEILPERETREVLASLGVADSGLGTREFAAAEARRGAQKIVDDLAALSREAENREDKISSVKERYLARKRQKIG